MDRLVDLIEAMRFPSATSKHRTIEPLGIPANRTKELGSLQIAGIRIEKINRFRAFLPLPGQQGAIDRCRIGGDGVGRRKRW